MKSLHELRESPEIEVLSDNVGEWMYRDAVPPIATWRDMAIGPLERCALRFTELASYWRTAAPPHELGGEFSVQDYIDAILSNEPPQLGWSGSSESELQFFSELRVIDGTPQSGVGTFSALRIQPNVDPLEMWFYDPELGPPESDVSYLRMDITYCEYLETLSVTKGVYNWQYLFTDIPLRGPWFERRLAELRPMLRIFPNIFPDYDYRPLAARLEERL
jgi:hypothetical protein